MSLQPSAEWVARLHAHTQRPPLRPRMPLWAGALAIGSVGPGLLDQISLQPASAGPEPLQKEERGGVLGWAVHGELTASLARVADALRSAGLAHTWRNEQLAVTDEAGRHLGSVERAVVRPLGIATAAVHLVGYAPDGRHWMQRRSLTKPNDPGLWDTLMGGMVPADESAEDALERETWEEAGLTLEQLHGLSRGGRVSTARPTEDGPGAGYVVEHIDWFRCILPTGVVPINQDGEVAEFRLMEGQEVLARLERDEFTAEAALILLQAGL